MTEPCIAIPFEPNDLAKLADLVTMGCENRTWFSDTDWAKGEPHRRAMVISRLSDHSARTWEVYRAGQLVGILQIDELVPGQDARAHLLFRDRSLADKRQLCLNMMGTVFEKYDLHVLRLEIPTYAAKLLGFARKALGFRFESENRPFSWPSSAAPLTADVARLGSRKHRAILHQGVWHDLLLLSLTRVEYEEAKERSHHRSDPVSAEAH